MGVLEELTAAVAAVHERVGPAVVGLGRGWGRGSGVVVAPGLVLTTAHILRGDEVAVARAGAVVLGRVAGVDPDLDVALIAADTGDAPAVPWDPGAAAALAPGAPVFALADPGGRGLRVTFGLVTATDRSFRGPRGRRIGGSIEHAAPLPRGSSGGPLVDPEGRLLGLNTLRLEGGLLLALPADAALRARVDALAAGGAPARPRLGLALSRRPGGLLVRGVDPDGPGAAAGLRAGDLLAAASGRPLGGFDDLFEALDAAQGELELVVVRDGAEHRVRACFSL